VIGFPHRTDGTFDDIPRMLAPLRSAGSQVPEARSKVGTPEDRVRDHGEQQHYRDRGAHPTVSSELTEDSVSSLGPYGVS
jgi:hypothetical protein